jgi:RND family efflux transporter MFP subunit
MNFRVGLGYAVLKSKLKKYINIFLEYDVNFIEYILRHKHWFTKKRLILMGLIVVLLLGGGGWLYLRYVRSFGLGIPTVTVAKVEKKTVPVWIDYVGTTASVKNVDIRARVEGFLIERAFKEGDDVKEGDLMFVIDKAPFEAALKKSKSQLDDAQASLALAKEQVERYTPLVQKEYVTQEQYDKLVTAMQEAAASVGAAEAQVKNDELNLGYCTMHSPVSGRVGRTFVHVGNLVGAGQDTRLATVVQLDPIYAYFSPSMDDLRKIQQYKAQGELPADIYFDDGTRYPYQGQMDFIDNVVEQSTSTVSLRATVPNPQKTILPGTYVNVRLFISTFPDALLVPSQAISEDQRGTYVLIVSKSGKVRESLVKAGPTFDKMRVILSGVKEGEQVVVEGVQMARPGLTVDVKVADPSEEKGGSL